MALEPGNLPATSHSAGLRPVTPRRMFARAAQWTLAVAFIVVFAIRHRYDLTLRSAGRRSNISGVFAGGVGRVTGRSQQVRGPEAR